MDNYFATNLKYLREKKKISQSQLSRMTKINQSSIARWEANSSSPSIDNVVIISKALNVPLPELIGVDLRLNQSISTATFKKDDMEITIGKSGEVTNDDLDEAMAFILAQKMKNKKDKGT